MLEQALQNIRAVLRALSSPTGPSDVFTILAIAATAVTFCVRTSCPEVLSPCIWKAGPEAMAADYVGQAKTGGCFSCQQTQGPDPRRFVNAELDSIHR